jgi:hypothetical protein
VEKCSERAGFVCRGGVQFLPLGCQETDDGQSWCVRNRSFFPSALHVVSNIERLSIQLILTRWNINMFWGLSTNDGIWMRCGDQICSTLKCTSKNDFHGKKMDFLQSVQCQL